MNRCYFFSTLFPKANPHACGDGAGTFPADAVWVRGAQQAGGPIQQQAPRLQRLPHSRGSQRSPQRGVQTRETGSALPIPGVHRSLCAAELLLDNKPPRLHLQTNPCKAERFYQSLLGRRWSESGRCQRCLQSQGQPCRCCICSVLGAGAPTAASHGRGTARRLLCPCPCPCPSTSDPS